MTTTPPPLPANCALSPVMPPGAFCTAAGLAPYDEAKPYILCLPSSSSPPSTAVSIVFDQLRCEQQLAQVLPLLEAELSEPYSVFTYRLFVKDWPSLCFLAFQGDVCVGVVLSKMDVRKVKHFHSQQVFLWETQAQWLRSLEEEEGRKKGQTEEKQQQQHARKENPRYLSLKEVEYEESPEYRAETMSYQQYASALTAAANIGSPNEVSSYLRGYIGMLCVSKSCRHRGVGSILVRLTLDAMVAAGAKEAVLETEADNTAALGLYARLEFMRTKRLGCYYLNGNDAFRLKLWFGGIDGRAKGQTKQEEEEQKGNRRTLIGK
eukprot:GHVS01051375.1.p1 GENE.GHVS01051375.1~~GHVS01051375.1.p1  ORF type:complete len:348 (-),score=86.31 GHVS01051375.1:161-1123(-)